MWHSCNIELALRTLNARHHLQDFPLPLSERCARLPAAAALAPLASTPRCRAREDRPHRDAVRAADWSRLDDGARRVGDAGRARGVLHDQPGAGLSGHALTGAQEVGEGAPQCKGWAFAPLAVIRAG